MRRALVPFFLNRRAVRRNLLNLASIWGLRQQNLKKNNSYFVIQKNSATLCNNYHGKTLLKNETGEVGITDFDLVIECQLTKNYNITFTDICFLFKQRDQMLILI